MKWLPALDVLSKCDLIIGRVFKRRHWDLLKYLHRIISHGLFYHISKKNISYNQYSQPWQISAPIFARSLALRELLLTLATKSHTSVSAFGAIYLPYLLALLLRERIDLLPFVQGLALEPKVRGRPFEGNFKSRKDKSILTAVAVIPSMEQFHCHSKNYYLACLYYSKEY